jgi:hypothetical protein
VGLDVPRAAAMITLGAIGLGALAALGVIARGGEMSETDWRLIGSLWSVLFCGSATLVALRFRIPYRAFAAAPVIAFVVVMVAIWSERIWDGNAEVVAKAVLSVLAATLCVLLVGSLRLQTAFLDRRLTLAYVGVAALMVVTTVYALLLLWAWDAPFVEGGGGRSENVANAAQRVLFALFSLSVLGYLATPLLSRVLPPESAESPR